MLRVRNQVGITEEMMRGLPNRPITVAVLDSGVSLHPDLSGRVMAFRDFVHERKEIYDDLGHGTHVCGILAGDGRCLKGMYRGIAPISRLVVGKVLDQKGNGDFAVMERALSWVEANRIRYRIRILNISVGIAEECDKNKRSLLQDQINRLWQLGVTVVCAAGNNGPGDNTISALGQRSKVIIVGCHDEEFCRKGRGCCEFYSGRGEKNGMLRKPDLVAPGTDIISCNAFYQNGRTGKNTFYISKSGTSMATPIVSGALALALQAKPELTNENLRSILTESARDLGEPWNKQGYGMLDLRKMMDVLEKFQ